MDNQNITTESKKEKLNSVKYPRGYFIGESEKSILINVNTDEVKAEVWIPKKFIKVSEFTLLASIAIIESYEFNTSTENVKIKGSDLLKVLKPLKFR